jgi:hypothetical protein
MLRKYVITVLLLIVSASTASAYENLSTADNEHARTWRLFAEKVYRLHERQLAGRSIRTTSKPGGYMNHPNCYVEVSYFDEATGLLLSRIKWRTEQPDSLHVIEVFVYDEQHRLLRDYTVAYVAAFYRHLQSSTATPNQALVNLHNRNGTLQAFRSFEADGSFVYEACSGEYEGRQVDISLDDEEKDDIRADSDSLLNSKEYQACFGGMPATAGEYLDPH